MRGVSLPYYTVVTEKDMKKNILKWALFLVPASLIVVFDQLSKAWAVSGLAGQKSIPLIPGVLELSYVENTGMAFGLLKDSRVFFFIATGLALAVILYFFIRLKFMPRFIGLVIVLSAVFAGAIGNLIDRIGRGFVVDFIYISLINFPVFNVADVFVTLGSIALAILLLFVYKEKSLKEAFPSRKAEKDNGNSDGQN